MLKTSNKKVLFLAKYAPVDGINYANDKSAVNLLVGYHKEVYDVLKKHYTVISSNKIDDIINYRNEIDYVFSIFHAAPFRNPEVFVSTIAEYAHLPYLGAPPNIRALAEDKHIAKMTALYAGIPTAKWITVDFRKPFDISQIPFEEPYFVKPRYGAASIYISQDNILESKKETLEKMRFFQDLKIDVIIEEYIQGIYHTVPAYSEAGEIKLLPCMKEITPETENIITYDQRIYLKNIILPTFINNENLINNLNNYTKRMYQLIEPLDFARFDYIVNEKDNKPYFIELNVCCSLGSYAEFAISAKRAGFTYEEMILMLVENSLQRQKPFV